MKTTTIFKSILFSLLTLVNIIWTQEVQAQEQRCVIDYIEFSPFNENTVNSQSFAEQDYAERILIDDLTTTVIVHPKNPAHCVGKNFNLSIASDYNATSALIVRDYTFNSEGKFSAKLYPGENVCSAPTGASNYCRYYAVLSHFWYGKYETFSSSSIMTPRPPQNSLHLPTQYPDTDIKEDKGTIVYKKIGDGKKRWTQNRTNTSSTQNCTILSAQFFPSGLADNNFIEQNSSASLKISTTGCIGKEIITTIYREKIGFDEKVEEAQVKGIVKSNIMNITYIPGDKDCNSSNTPDCKFSSRVFIAGNSPVQNSTHDSAGKPLGEIHYNCHNKPGTNQPECTRPWQAKTVSGITLNSSNPIGGNVVPQGTIDVESPCFSNGAYTPGCYELLAPIPGVGGSYTDGDGVVRNTGFRSYTDSDGVVRTTGFKEQADGRQAIFTDSMALGDYINQIFRIALGILMVVSVIMIIIAGVEYMAVESIYGKTNAKTRITDALTGLLIGLGIFLILSTINPRLLDVNFSPKEVSIGFKVLNDIDLTGFGGDSSNGGSSGTGNSVTFANSAGVLCPKTGGNKETLNLVARSFAGKITYRFGAKGGSSSSCPNGQVCVDCSGYASLLLKCSGYKDFGAVGTSNIFSNSNRRIAVKPGSLTDSSFINADTNQRVNLLPGDMIGWLAGEAGQRVGHVYVYLGDGLINDSNASKNKATGVAQGVYNLKSQKVLSKANSRIRWVVRP